MASNDRKGKGAGKGGAAVGDAVPAGKTRAGERAKVSALARHIEELGREVSHLKKAARREIEERWALHHTDVFPRLLQWKEALGVETYAVFTVVGQELRPEPLLSAADAPRPEGSLHAKRDRGELETWWGAHAGDLVAFALASRELQIDFRTGVLCLPVVFFDKPTGLVLARVRGLSKSAYGKILSESATLLAHVRQAASAGQEDGGRSGLASAS